MISNIQLENAKNEISLNILKNGNLIHPQVLLEQLNYFFQDKKIGLPFYNPQYIEKYSVTDGAQWNFELQNIKKDLDLLFQ